MNKQGWVTRVGEGAGGFGKAHPTGIAPSTNKSVSPDTTPGDIDVEMGEVNDMNITRRIGVSGEDRSLRTFFTTNPMLDAVLTPSSSDFASETSSVIFDIQNPMYDDGDEIKSHEEYV